MAVTPENRVKARVKALCREHNVHYIMPVTGGFGGSGAPDFLLCVNGVFVTVETKADCLRHLRGDMHRGKRIKTGAPTALQQQHMQQIRASGGVTMVIDRHNVEVLGEFLRRANTRGAVGAGALGVLAELLGVLYTVEPDMGADT